MHAIDVFDGVTGSVCTRWKQCILSADGSNGASHGAHSKKPVIYGMFGRCVHASDCSGRACTSLMYTTQFLWYMSTRTKLIDTSSAYMPSIKQIQLSTLKES